MKTLSVLGTAAMFLVGGGIVAHGWHRLEATIEQAAHWLGQQGLVGSALALITPTLLNGLIGLLLGGLVYGVSLLVKRVLQRKA
jgi:predicted DNA repair protein MutK